MKNIATALILALAIGASTAPAAHAVTTTDFFQSQIENGQ